MSLPDTMSHVLRNHLNRAVESGITFRAIERDTGVLRQSLMKFARNESSLRLDVADRLAAYFRLELRPEQPTKRT
jgi:transcriptional regulator with XRE-family HTH domain